MSTLDKIRTGGMAFLGWVVVAGVVYVIVVSLWPVPQVHGPVPQVVHGVAYSLDNDSVLVIVNNESKPWSNAEITVNSNYDDENDEYSVSGLKIDPGGAGVTKNALWVPMDSMDNGDFHGNDAFDSATTKIATVTIWLPDAQIQGDIPVERPSLSKVQSAELAAFLTHAKASDVPIQGAF